jgi:hypothetical protein
MDIDTRQEAIDAVIAQHADNSSFNVEQALVDALTATGVDLTHSKEEVTILADHIRAGRRPLVVDEEHVEDAGEACSKCTQPLTPTIEQVDVRNAETRVLWVCTNHDCINSGAELAPAARDQVIRRRIQAAPEVQPPN